jgi:glycosyltransferase involved in cell wall biosynthesis
MMLNQPLVSVGIPAFNRAAKLRRAIQSVLAQDYTNIELVISDDASVDETENVCLEFCERDSRVRYIKQATNLGLTENYNAVQKESHGDFFMWLSDDDWLDGSYISQCLGALLEHPDYLSVAGRAKYFQEDGEFLEGEVDLLQETGTERVLAFYRHVERNGTLYGLMRRDFLSDVRFPHAMGADWFFTASVAFQGKVKILEGVFINRKCEGISEDLQRLAQSFGLKNWRVANPIFSLTLNVFDDIVWRTPVYQKLGIIERIGLGARAGLTVYRRYSGFDRHSPATYIYQMRSRLSLRTRWKRLVQKRQIKKSRIL